jgi:nitrite reductase/ring-hydroxylating ferredoxin subunit
MRVHRLCELDDLADPGSRAFTLGAGAWPLRGFVVRRGADVYAYVNRCPHAGHPLNWSPDRFLSPDGALIQCQSHGALFDIASGRCVAGPCPGRALARLDARVENGVVMLEGDIEALAHAHS